MVKILEVLQTRKRSDWQTARLIAYLLAFVVVFWQSLASRGAFFYSDDFTLIAAFDRPIQNIFSLDNGHFAPLVKIIYWFLFQIFGISSYTPFLVIAGVCNLAFAMSFVRFLVWNKFPKSLFILGAPLVLIVPGSAHTIFWVASAINLLVPALALHFATLEDSRLSNILTFVYVAIGIGLGGYGLILVISIISQNIFKRRFKLTAFAAIPILVIGMVYRNNAGGNFSYLNLNFLKWIFASSIGLFQTFAPETSLDNGVASSLSILAILGFFYVFLNLRAFWKEKLSRNLESLLVGIVFLLSFVILLWPTRGGVEPFTASRYVVLFDCFFLIIFVSSCFLWMDQLGMNEKKRNLIQKFLVFASVLTILLRVPYWHQAPLDVNFQSSLNRTTVSNIICSSPLSQPLLSTAVAQDGLTYLPLSLKSSLWTLYRAKNC